MGEDAMLQLLPTLGSLLGSAAGGPAGGALGGMLGSLGQTAVGAAAGGGDSAAVSPLQQSPETSPAAPAAGLRSSPSPLVAPRSPLPEAPGFSGPGYSPVPTGVLGNDLDARRRLEMMQTLLSDLRYGY